MARLEPKNVFNMGHVCLTGIASSRQDGWGGADGGDGGSSRSQASRCGLKKLKISIHG